MFIGVCSEDTSLVENIWAYGLWMSHTHLKQDTWGNEMQVLLQSGPAALLGHVWTLKSLSTTRVQYNLQCYAGRKDYEIKI